MQQLSLTPTTSTKQCQKTFWATSEDYVCPTPTCLKNPIRSQHKYMDNFGKESSTSLNLENTEMGPITTDEQTYVINTSHNLVPTN